MHLIQAGVNLIYIRDLLGHADVSTTEIYARADAEAKRKAIQNAYQPLTPDVLPDWTSDTSLSAGSTRWGGDRTRKRHHTSSTRWTWPGTPESGCPSRKVTTEYLPAAEVATPVRLKWPGWPASAALSRGGDRR